MARLARVVAIDAPQHITQRGNARQFLFECDPGRLVWLGVLRPRSQPLNLAAQRFGPGVPTRAGRAVRAGRARPLRGGKGLAGRLYR